MNFFSGSVARDSRSILLVGGASIAGEGERLGAPGREVVVGVRPDALTLAPPRIGGLGGRVERIEVLGGRMKDLHVFDAKSGQRL